MRSFLTIASTVLIVIAAVMVVWRPALGFALALVGFCVNLARLKRAARSARKPEMTPANAAPAIPLITPRRPAPGCTPFPETPANDHAAVPEAAATPAAANSLPTELLDRVVAAGWQATARGAALFCVRGGTRLALLQAAPEGPTAADVAAASRLRTRYHTDFVGILSPERPDPALGAQGVDLGVQFVNTARLEAYLAMASSFKPDADRRETA